MAAVSAIMPPGERYGTVTYPGIYSPFFSSVETPPGCRSRCRRSASTRGGPPLSRLRNWLIHVLPSFTPVSRLSLLAGDEAAKEREVDKHLQWASIVLVVSVLPRHGPTSQSSQGPAPRAKPPNQCSCNGLEALCAHPELQKAARRANFPGGMFPPEG
ncbi:hypothetical protein LZ30DRAFT_125901 [Colletotrichum cereale]|nr:hypothetical protein LZ30DRAFT_125901 [Colletotrichum cereale]